MASAFASSDFAVLAEAASHCDSRLVPLFQMADCVPYTCPCIRTPTFLQFYVPLPGRPLLREMVIYERVLGGEGEVKWAARTGHAEQHPTIP